MNEQNLDGLLGAVNGTSAKVIDGEGKLIVEGVVVYSGTAYEKRLSLGQMEIPRESVLDVCPSAEGFKTLIFIDQKYAEVHA